MREGMTGDPSILIAKSFLDFFTAMIFACSLGIAVSAIAAPMLLIQFSLATCAALILPLTTPAMMADFSSVGGYCWSPLVYASAESKCLPWSICSRRCSSPCRFPPPGPRISLENACNNSKVVIDCAVCVELKKFR